MTRLVLGMSGVYARRVGCDKCGRGTDRVVFETHDDTLQELSGEIAAEVWSLLEAEARRNTTVFSAPPGIRVGI